MCATPSSPSAVLLLRGWFPALCLFPTRDEAIVFEATSYSTPCVLRCSSTPLGTGCMLCFMFGAQAGGGGMRSKKVCVPKIGLSFLALCSKLHFSPEENLFGVGGWMVWPGGGGGGRGSPDPGPRG